MAQTLLEKITQRFAVGREQGRPVRVGDVVRLRPAHVMTHDNTGAVLPKFGALGVDRVRDPRQLVFALDHDVQNESAENLSKYRAIEKFARDQGVAFFPAKSGISHQLMVEEGFVHPGTFVVGSDSHSNLYGALGAVGTPVVRTDAATIWATGETWWEVPPVARVRLTGKLRPGVVGKDVIISLIGTFRHDELLNHAVEFVGEGIKTLSIDQRMTIANMTTEWGALAGIFPFDETCERYLRKRADAFVARGDAQPRLTHDGIDGFRANVLVADHDAVYSREITFDLSRVIPHVAGPNEVKAIHPLPAIASRNIEIHKAYLLSCVNSRLEDLCEAAGVVRGRVVSPGVRFYVAAASATIEEEAKALGAWGDLIAAGAIPLPPGCGPCIGLGEGTLEANEVGISATNRNFRGRMGSREAECYLASPAVVAASAIAGRITGPRTFETEELVTSYRANESTHSWKTEPGKTEPVTLQPGFPESLEGELVFLPKDDMNTDGIYAKDVTYRDDLSPERVASYAFGNYDPDFQSVARSGDILVGGRNFGSGSSREQAATALVFFGIPLVIGVSFAQTYKRNAFNNGLLLIECPSLVEMLFERHRAESAATIRTGLLATVRFSSSEVYVGGATFSFSPLGELPQRLVVAKGVANLVREPGNP